MVDNHSAPASDDMTFFEYIDSIAAEGGIERDSVEYAELIEEKKPLYIATQHEFGPVERRFLARGDIAKAEVEVRLEALDNDELDEWQLQVVELFMERRRLSDGGRDSSNFTLWHMGERGT